MEDLESSDEINARRTISTGLGIFLSINGAIGAGILNMPYAFMRTGNFIYALLMEIAISILIFITFSMIAIVVHKKDHLSYMEMVGDNLGKNFRTITEIIIVLYTLVACSAYAVIMGNQLTLGSTLFITDSTKWYVDRRFLMTVSTLVAFLPFLFPKNLKILSKTSVIGGICCLYIILSVTIKYFGFSKDTSFIPVQQTSHPNVLSYINLLTALAFGFQSHLSSVSLLSQLKEAKLKVYILVLGLALLIVAVMYAFIGITGMLTFGIETKTDILLNYHPKDIVMGVGRFMLMFILVVSNALTAYVGRLSLHNLVTNLYDIIFKKINSASSQINIEDTKPVYWYASAIAWHLCCIIIGIFVPNIGSLIPFLGAFAAYVILICPTIIFMVHDNIEENSIRFILKWFISLIIIIIGSFIFAMSAIMPFIDKFIP